MTLRLWQGVSAALILGGLAVTGANAAQVITQDLVVQGSTCTGFDCVNGESFSFDTFRLKENNLRIHFDDTSSSASFPSNDWRIVANDSRNGGASYLGIEDSTAGRMPFRVEAGAPANTLYVESDGDVGIKTSNPVVDLHIVEGNTPAVRLEQDGSDGFQSQIYDVAANETNFFIRDVTNGSKLAFRMRPGAPENSIFVDADGDIGFGTAAPAQDLDINGSTISGVTTAGVRIGSVDMLTSTDTGNVTANKVSLTHESSLGVRLGVGALTPSDNLHLRSPSGNVGIVLETPDQPQAIRMRLNGANNRFTIAYAGSGINQFSLDNSGNLELEGGLVTGTSGSCTSTSPCDRVFDSSYKVPSIEDHAKEMWAKKHLPTVGPTKAGDRINVTVKLTRMLNELEKAHIYIEQLHKRLRKLEAGKTVVR